MPSGHGESRWSKLWHCGSSTYRCTNPHHHHQIKKFFKKAKNYKKVTFFFPDAYDEEPSGRWQCKTLEAIVLIITDLDIRQAIRRPRRWGCGASMPRCLLNGWRAGPRQRWTVETFHFQLPHLKVRTQRKVLGLVSYNILGFFLFFLLIIIISLLVTKVHVSA